MHTNLRDHNGQDGNGLRLCPVRQHDTKDERDPKEASELMDTQITFDPNTGNIYELETFLNTRDPIRAALDVVGLKLYLTCSKSVTNTITD